MKRSWLSNLVLLAAVAALAWLFAAPLALGLGVRPVDGAVVRGFDPPDKPWLAGHRGVDLKAAEGTPVRAAADGRIGFAGEVGHMPVGDPAAVCGCGRRGCWEASIGLHAMLDAVGMTELATPLDTARAVASAPSASTCR